MKSLVTPVISSLTLSLLFSCKKENYTADEEVEVITSNGNIQVDVDAFKIMPGQLNTTPGAVGGHGEINWEGIPDDLPDKQLPDNFFDETGPNAVVARQGGIKYAGGSFMISSSGFTVPAFK